VPTTETAPIFAALGDELRLQLVDRLGSGGPLSIAQLTEGTRVTRQGVTKHLSILAQAGLARSYRRGRERLWEIDRRRLDQARSYLDELSHQWDQALARLKQAVED
jgi:DNA-binding transcriptional ArsR family regulator